MKKSLIIIAFILISSLNLVLATPNPSIWLTLDSCNTKDNSVNELNYQDHVFINGEGFQAFNQFRDWSIQGTNTSCNPNIIIANGSTYIDGIGSTCIEAYIVNQNNCGDYKFFIGGRYTTAHVNQCITTIPEFPPFIIPLIFIASILGYFLFIRK